MEKMIKVLLFTYGEEVPNPHYVKNGDQPEYHVVEGLARLGQVVDITRQYDLDRGEKHNAFFTDEEREAIEAGSYSGPDAPSVLEARLKEAQSAIQPADGEGTQGDHDIAGLDADGVADLILEGNDGKGLNVQQTIALAGDDADSINIVLEAESLAAETEPRAGVVKGLEAKLKAANA
jgi:hypothetical protein